MKTIGYAAQSTESPLAPFAFVPVERVIPSIFP